MAVPPARLSWDVINPDYESGLDRGVFFLSDGRGTVWNGLASVVEDESDSEGSPRYFDGVKVGNRSRSGQFSGTIEAYTYPEMFYENVLTQRRPTYFGLAYRVKTDTSYKIHLVYNALIAPDTRSYKQLDDPSIFSWSFTTLASVVKDGLKSAHLIVDASKAYSGTMAALEEVLYGSDLDPSRLPSPEEVLEIFEENSIVRVIDNGDGSFTVTGPDEAVMMLDTSTFQIVWESAVVIDSISYTLSSL